MVLGHFILFRQGSILRASRLAGSSRPSAFRYSDRLYREADFQIPLFNHLLITPRQLAGFSFNQAEGLSKSRLIRDSENVIDMAGDGSYLWFVLASVPLSALNVNSSQALAACVYGDGHSDHIIAVPDFTEWGKLWDGTAFDLVHQDAPVPTEHM